MLDIVEILEDCVQLSAEYGVPKDSLKSKLMLEAAEEIKRLRKEIDSYSERTRNSEKN